ncbi:MAG: zinc ribbon domain-containing protein [Anaerolineae bacterium]|nr:zinc ribbon domain-containing protein [Anaerolineae bacterium]
MPIYSFRCEQCGTVFEVRASIKEKENGLEPTCPKCQDQHSRQIITAGLLVHESGNSGPSFAGCGPNARPGCCG